MNGDMAIDAAGWARLSDLFDAAIDLDDAARAALLDRLRASDPDLAQQLAGLLAAAGSAGDFLEAAPPAPMAETGLPPGTRIGAWLVQGELGRGGMGIVHAVTREEGGFVQAGALKIMRTGSAGDTQRFLRERQVLAQLTHPGIARVFDGGAGADGLWMVQERIDGQPIDQYCTARGSSLPDRIALVRHVVAAVASAHAALVLHRDIKPGNVLVDGQGHVKVIDFGLAKSLGLGADTVGPLPVSAPYVAPELLTGAPAGPPCDVYGVAALLYELACGQPPIDLAGLPAAIGIGRVLDTAPLPLAQRPAPVLAAADTALVADLDAVLMKALRKEPEARYQTLAALDDDLAALQDRRPVTARAGETGYRLRRQLRRWRWPLAAAAAILITLLGGLAATLWQAREALAARDRMLAEEARSESVRQSLYLLLSESAEVVGDGSDRRAVLAKAAARLQGRLDREPQSAAVLYALGELFFYLGDYEGAIANLRLVTAAGNRVDPATLAAARFDLAQALVRNGAPEDAPALLAAAQRFWAGDPVKWRGKLIDSRVVEALLLREKDPRAALALIETALVEQERQFGRNTHQTGVFYNNIGVGRQAAGDLPGARAALLQAQAIWQAIGEADSPDALNTANNLASIAVLGGDLAGAEPLFAEAVRIRRSVYGPSAGTAALLNNLGKVRLKLGRHAEAAGLLREAATMGERFAGSASQLHVSALAGLSEAEIAGGNAAAGLSTARRAVAAATTSPGLVQQLAAIALGRALAATGDKSGAVRVLMPVKAAAAGPGATQIQAAVAAIAGQYQLNF